MGINCVDNVHMRAWCACDLSSSAGGTATADGDGPAGGELTVELGLGLL
jgi:hypothetical protein